MAQISFRMDDDLKAAVETTFKSIGNIHKESLTQILRRDENGCDVHPVDHEGDLT